MDLEDDAASGRVSHLAVVAGASGAAAAAMAVMAAFRQGAEASEIDLIFFLLSGLFLLVCLVSLLALAMRRRLIRDGGAAFVSLLEDCAAPAMMSDEHGVVGAANAAARRGASRTRSAGKSATEYLAGWVADPAAVLYRLTKRALADGSAAEIVTTPEGGSVVLRASRLANRRVLWMLREESAARIDDHSDAPYVFFRISNTEGETQGNLTYKALSPEDRDAIAAAARSAATEKSTFAEAHLSKGSVSVIVSSYPGGWNVISPISAGAPSADLMFEELPVALARLSTDGELLAANESARALLGDDVRPGALLSALVEGIGRPLPQRLAEAAEGRGVGRADLARGLREDKEVFLRIGFRAVHRAGSEELLAVLSDATELRTLEQQFVQSQKMQAVGQLAGGVAHDFNNLLTAILGHCDLMALRRDEADPDFEDLSQIRQNANRAAALVRQLLAFSRQQTLNPQVCALTDTLSELSHLLNRLLGEKTSLDVDAGAELWPVWIDERQFEQVILNLVVNARDAMPNGGQIAISCHNERRDHEEERDRARVPAGEYVVIEVTDNGMGMSEETIAKAFEPFFTTKGPGEGTGLGLSTAYGIVKQTGGFIFIDSAIGRGTTFRILLPRLDRADEPVEDAVVVAPRDLTGVGRILLVEDEAPVRTFARRALVLRGYDVVEADSAEAALEIFAQCDESGEEFDLVVSDVMMPGMDGPTWVRIVHEKRPDLPVIFTSGYAEDVFRKDGVDLGKCDFLPKPFSLDDLGAAVKGKLEDGAA